MARSPRHDWVVPLIGILACPPLPDGVDARLEAHWGAPWRVSPGWPFEATHYYASELGSPLIRTFCAFTPRPAELAAWKLTAGQLERECMIDGRRRVNLDPGYVSLGGLFLASTKAGGHRIPIAAGLYAEITLYFHRGAWMRLPWTFPDFASGLYDGFLEECRAELRCALRTAGDA
jgi:hypothetical protein